MLVFSILILIASLLFAVAAWRRGRPRGWIFPSDALFIACFVFAGVAPLINLRATTTYSVNFHYDDAVITRTLFAIALMFTIFGLVWMSRRVIRVSSLLDGSVTNEQVPQLVLMSTVAACALSFVLMFADPQYREFRIDVLQFVTGQLSGVDYQFSRRFAFEDNFLVSQVIGRLRYSVFAFLYAVSGAYLLAKKRNILISAASLSLIFFLLSSSVSKLPFVYFFMYTAVIFMVFRTKGSVLQAKWLIPAVVIAGGLTLLLLSGLYMIQYPDLYVGIEGFFAAFNLGLYRVFGATYDGMLQYFTVYPHGLPFAYFMDSSIVAFIFDRPAREIIAEVPVYFIGSQYYGFTTTPTIFIGGGYASVGYLGVALYSLVVSVFVVWVDHVIVQLRQVHLRVAVYATMMLNVVFFSMIAAPTVFLTYGAALIPLAALFLDGQLRPGQAKAKQAVQFVEGDGTSASTSHIERAE